VHGVDNLGDGAIRAHTRDRSSGAIHGKADADELAAQDVAEELTTDRARARGCPDHGNRLRVEKGPQRRDDADMIALVDAFTESLGRFEREAYLGRPEDGFAGGLEPCVGE